VVPAEGVSQDGITKYSSRGTQYGGDRYYSVGLCVQRVGDFFVWI